MLGLFGFWQFSSVPNAGEKPLWQPGNLLLQAIACVYTHSHTIEHTQASGHLSRYIAVWP